MAEAAVRVERSRPDDSDPGVAVQLARERGEVREREPRVGVEEEDVPRRPGTPSCVAAARKAAVRGHVDHVNTCKALDDLVAPLRACVVHHEDRDSRRAGERLDAGSQAVAAVVGHDHDVDG